MRTDVLDKPIHITDATFDETVGGTGKIALVDIGEGIVLAMPPVYAFHRLLPCAPASMTE